jgi:hypothetical protein
VTRRALLAAVFVSGCGYVGEPLPPLLNIPSRVSDLQARQIGAGLHIEFTIPPLTTEGEVLKNLERIDLRVGPSPGTEFNADAWAASAQQITVQPVERTVRAKVPLADWAGKEVIAGVDLVAANGRHSGWSNLMTVAVLPPIAPPTDIQIENVREGVRLSWRAGAAQVRIFRKTAEEKEFTAAGESAANEWIDRATRYGARYSYKLQAVAKTATGEAWSEFSPDAGITPDDRFPPALPAGLTAVASTSSVELVWEASPDAVSYRVYRAGPGEPLKELADPATGAAYSDRGVESGKTYRYAVSAVDGAGNESQKSAEVEVRTL